MPRNLFSLYDRFYTFAEEVTAARRLPKEILHRIRAQVGLTEENFLGKIDFLEVKFLRSQRSVPYEKLREAYDDRMFIWGLISRKKGGVTIITDGGWGPAQILYEEVLYNAQKAKALVAYKLYDDARSKHKEEQQHLKDEIRKVEMEYLEFMNNNNKNKKEGPGPTAVAVKKKKKEPTPPQQPPNNFRPPQIVEVTSILIAGVKVVGVVDDGQ